MLKFTRFTKSAILFAAVLALLVVPLPARRAAPASTSYAAVTVSLDRFIRQQMREKELPALSIAVVDGQKIVWTRGYGYADPARKIAATPRTVYRVGSVSKLFTDIAIMQLVERGKLDLDAPITRYLPDFHPHNSFGTPITLRELMAHRSGLVREPPVGNYFDSSSPSLAATVESLNRTSLVYAPKSHTKYSNAGIAVVGYVLERESGRPFDRDVERQVLEPMGLDDSSFALTPSLQARLAKGLMWTYDDLAIPTPTFALGLGPAGNLYSTVLDLGRFLEVLFADGQSARGAILEPESLHEMWQIQFAKAGATSGFGLGFDISRLDGHLMVGHAGGIYGFATQLSALPDEKLGVAVVTTVDSANSVTARIADVALRMMLAARHKQRMPEVPESSPISPESARALAGHYGALSGAFDLVNGQSDDDSGNQIYRLLLLPDEGGFMVPLRKMGANFVEDGRLSYGGQFTPVAGGMRMGDTIFRKMELPIPQAAPESWQGLIGEYGWNYDELYILEKAGKLTALIEWFEYDPLTEISSAVFAFPRHGLYDNERATFTQGANGVATQVQIGGVVFPRIKLGGIEGPFFHITPVKPVPELRREALAATPPAEHSQFLKPDLVDVTSLDPTIKLDIRYATPHDFLRTPVYTEAKAFLQRPAAEALVRVSRRLAPLGYGLLIHDAYRPWYVTKIFWDATPPDKKIFVADPRLGSRHNRGCAVDLTLYNLKTGKQVPMTGHYDEMTERSYAFFPGGTSIERWYRGLLRQAMESEGFTVYQFEWWHFDYQGWQHYPILNLTFEQLSRPQAQLSPNFPPTLSATGAIATSSKEPNR